MLLPAVLVVGALVVPVPGGAVENAAQVGAEPRGDWTCVPVGRKCTFSSDCCTKYCVSDPKLGKVCKTKS